jgi:hypothetical protein
MARVIEKLPDDTVLQLPAAVRKAIEEVLNEQMQAVLRGLYDELEPKQQRSEVWSLNAYRQFDSKAREGFVYALRDSGFVKVGWTRNLATALARYNQPMPIPRGEVVEVSRPFLEGSYASIRIQRYLKRELGADYPGPQGWCSIEHLETIRQVFNQVEKELPCYDEPISEMTGIK